VLDASAVSRARDTDLLRLCVRAGRHLPGIRISIRRALPSTGWTHPRGTHARPPEMYRDRHINYHRRAQRRGGAAAGPPQRARARRPPLDVGA
jgi:hypothetical protein